MTTEHSVEAVEAEVTRIAPRFEAARAEMAKVLVGQRYAGQLVTIEIGETTLTVYDEHAHHVITQIPRTSTRPLTRFKAYGVRNRTTG